MYYSIDRPKKCNQTNAQKKSSNCKVRQFKNQFDSDIAADDCRIRINFYTKQDSSGKVKQIKLKQLKNRL